MSEVIESASGPVGAVVVPGLEDDVDVGAVLARARTLATGDLDGELEALREQAAAPLLEIAIEAASAELANQLGGVPVRRQRWAPAAGGRGRTRPPGVRGRIGDRRRARRGACRDLPAGARRAAACEHRQSEDAEEDLSPGIIERDASDAVHLRRSDDEIEQAVATLSDDDPQPEHEVDDGQIDDEIHQLSEADFEEVEQTQVGADPSFDDRAYPAGSQSALAERLDAHLAEAEAEADADDLGLNRASLDTGYVHQRPPSGDYEDMSAERAISVGGEYESAYVEQHGTLGALDQSNEIPAVEDASLDDALEIDDFEILAEADEDDADLLASHGEADVSGSRSIAADPGHLRRPSLSDFASRLDLGDDSDVYPPAPEPEPGFYQRPRNVSDELPSHRESIRAC